MLQAEIQVLLLHTSAGVSLCMQVYGDHLWSSLGNSAIPNDGFLSNAVVPPGLGSLDALQGGDDIGDEAASGEGEEAQAASSAPAVQPAWSDDEDDRTAGRQPHAGSSTGKEVAVMPLPSTDWRAAAMVFTFIRQGYTSFVPWLEDMHRVVLIYRQ